MPILQKWRAGAGAERYAKSTESAPVAARLAFLSRVAEKNETLEAVKRAESASFTEDGWRASI
jgi:hypothetical protein